MQHMVKRFLTFLAIIGLFHNASMAEPWTVGQQTITYPSSGTVHILGDGSDSRGGQAPAYAYEDADVATDSTLKTLWTHDLTVSGGGGQYADSASGGAEAKARFDCNVSFEAHDDPIIAPGVQNGATHDHTFIGNVAAASAPYAATYATLRAGGNSTCYGGPLNRTLYWEPSMKVLKNGVPVTLKPVNIITYYNCGGITNEPPKCSRWPRGLTFIGGFDMNDPTNSYQHNQIAAIDPLFNKYMDPSVDNPGNGFIGYQCNDRNSTHPGYTSYAPKQDGNAFQPYLNDGLGHATLDCQSVVVDGKTVYKVNVQVNAENCWDGVNLHSPNGRRHMAYSVRDKALASAQECPDHWYKIPVFLAIIQFHFRAGEMDTAYLSSDRMPGMTQFKGGETMHFDLIPAWDYGTGDHPGVMLKFFQHCGGLTMHVKNSDGTTYTDLTGDPHECGYARIDATENLFVNEASPDGSLPNPVVDLGPNQSINANRYFMPKNGTSLPGVVLKPHP
jgi:hypothetical protein